MPHALHAVYAVRRAPSPPWPLIDTCHPHIQVGHSSMWHWQLLTQMDKSFESQKGMGLQAEGESDEVKRVLLEGNPVLLAITFVVSMLHTVFDMLAFKNDIGFWKDNKSMEVSVGCARVLCMKGVGMHGCCWLWE